MRVSVIVTVRNEAATVGALLDALAAQTRPPDEVVIVDGGSSDRTVERIREAEARLPLRLLECPGANIAAGRNRAIEAATGELIASTDAGTRPDPAWLARLAAALESGADVAMGFFRAAPTNAFERVLAATTLPDVEEIDPERFVPSSRSIAYRRDAWERVGGYPEWLDYGEDVVFDFTLRRAGLRFAWVPDALVAYRPRPSVAAFFRQYYRYARGDGKANLWPCRHAIRYATYTLAPLATVLGFWYKRLWLAMALAAGLYLYRPYRRLWRRRSEASWGDVPLIIAAVPALRLVGDVAKLLGYPAGLQWRLGGKRRNG
jgi:glycosyltransferase involved in cell wall biosynthesis